MAAFLFYLVGDLGLVSGPDLDFGAAGGDAKDGGLYNLWF